MRRLRHALADAGLHILIIAAALALIFKLCPTVPWDD